MKRYINEDINVGDEVFIPGDEYHATVVAIKGDRVKVDGPMGVEYKNMSELEKQESEEDMPPPSFGRPSSMERQFKPRGFGGYVSENRKKVVRLTESDLTRIVKRVISEQPNSGMSAGVSSTGKPTPTRTSTPTTRQPNSGMFGGEPTAGQVKRSLKITKSITPKIDIDCVNKVIIKSELPKLPEQSNRIIINHYCSK